MNSEDFYTWRYWLLLWLLITTLGGLLIGVFRLTVIRSSYYRGLAFENKIVETKIPAGRGSILDRKGRVLSKSVYQYFALENGTKVYKESGDYKGSRFEGKDRLFELRRQYEYGESLGLVTGYVGAVNNQELKEDRCGSSLGNFEIVGRGGLEEYFDCDLRGVEGKRLVEVDAKGNYIRELGRMEPEKGKDLKLSLDAFWQDKIFKMLGDKKAVVIMSEPKTGKIISLVSSPSIDPNVFSNQIDNQKIKSYLEDNVNFPLLNRAIAAKYHPGSVYKIVLAAGALQSKKIDASWEVEDTGVIKIGEYSYANWLWNKSGGTDGMVNLIKALKRSNDIYFYRLGEKIGVDTIKEWSEKFGYGQKTGIELAGEIAGIVPDNSWKIESKGERWYLGDTYHLSIGQGFLGVTPLQVNQATNIIANKGVKCQMSILKDGKLSCKNIGIDPKNIEVVRQGMLAACHLGGTAWPLFNFKTNIACKTGTAEVGDGSKDTHAWLTAFAPADDPEISITVMLERGGEGSDVAAPIVGDILKEWFDEPNTIVPRKGQ